MKLILLALSLTACAVHNHVYCAGDTLPMTTDKYVPGDTISFPASCAADYVGGTAATAGGGHGPILFAAGR